ncbi:MAG: LOG family protein, partial [Thermaurantiacus tibetensis]
TQVNGITRHDPGFFERRVVSVDAGVHERPNPLDELFELLTLMQTGKMQRVPLVLFGRDYWRRVICFEALAEEGVIDPADLDLFRMVETADEAWAHICATADPPPAA